MIVDLDNAATWPDAMRQRLQARRDEPALTELQGHNIRLFHCTRLRDEELEDITTNGLAPLTVELVHRRVDKALAAGDINEEQAATIRRKHDARNRKGSTFLCTSRQSLNDETGVYRLLDKWGGEAIHDAELELNIGRATIIEIALPAELIGFVHPGLELITWRTIHEPERGGHATVCPHDETTIEPQHIIGTHQHGSDFFTKHLPWKNYD